MKLAAVRQHSLDKNIIVLLSKMKMKFLFIIFITVQRDYNRDCIYHVAIYTGFNIASINPSVFSIPGCYL